MRVRILRDRLLKPADTPRVIVQFTADTEVTIRRAWGAALVASGDAVEVPVPSRQAEASEAGAEA